MPTRLRLLCMALLLISGSASAQESPDKSKDTMPVKIAPNIKAEALWDGRKIVPFKAIDSPKMVKASEADFMDDTNYILGVTIGGESRAYPTRFIWWHHVINDKMTDSRTGKETEFAVTYCSVCNTGIRYNLRLNDKPILLDFYGLYNGVVTLCERETASVLLQVSGEFVTGDLLGGKLQPAPLLDTTWGEWKRLHPDTLVMSPDTPYSKFYRPKDNPEPRGYDRFPRPYFNQSMTRGDKRLPPFDKVLGVALLPAGEAPAGAIPLRRAYPVKALQEAGGALNDTLASRPIAVLFAPDTVTANAFSRMVDGKTLTFTAQKGDDGKVTFTDKETGTRWSIEGKGEEGPLAGKTLEHIENHLSQWYGWVAYFPETTIYGRTDPPQPGDPFADAEKAAQEKAPNGTVKEKKAP